LTSSCFIFKLLNLNIGIDWNTKYTFKVFSRSPSGVESISDKFTRSVTLFYLYPYYCTWNGGYWFKLKRQETYFSHGFTSKKNQNEQNYVNLTFWVFSWCRPSISLAEYTYLSLQGIPFRLLVDVGDVVWFFVVGRGVAGDML